MSAEAKQVVKIDPSRSVVIRMADRFGVDADKMMSTLKSTAFKGDQEISNEQMMALLIVAEQHGLNPWTKEIYAFSDRKGIVPVVGVDGWSRIINEHPQFNGMAFTFDKDENSITCVIHRKDRQHPTTVTEYMAECKRKTGPWDSHPRRMLRHKAMIQCARLAFGFAGIYDPDEAERIIDVTPARTSTTLAEITASKPAVADESAEPGTDDLEPIDGEFVESYDKAAP